jgi:hypothetical protein
MAALLKFTSHIAGKNAEVEIHEDRIEWQQQGRVSAAKDEAERIKTTITRLMLN